MKLDFDDFYWYEQEKVTLLLKTAVDLGYDLKSAGEIVRNNGSGDIYLRLEGMPCELCMPLNTEVARENILCVEYEAGIYQPLGKMDYAELEDFFNKQ